MKDNTALVVLVVLLFLAGLAACGLALKYAFDSRDLRQTQAMALVVNNRLNLAQALLNDTIEYSKRNPSVETLLLTLGLKTNAPAATPAPAQATPPRR
jgi:hypothetical protein